MLVDSAIRRSRTTARKVAPTPIIRARPDSSHTLLSTVKSRSAEDSDCTFPPLCWLSQFLVNSSQPGQGADKLWSKLVQLACVVDRESLNHLPALLRKIKKN